MLDINSLRKNSSNTGNNATQGQTSVRNEAEIPRPKLEFPSIDEGPNYTNIFTVIVAVIFLVAGILLYVLQTTKTSALKTKESMVQDLTKQLNTTDMLALDKKVQDLQSGIGAYSTALTGKLYWSNLFTVLQKVTPKNVKFTAFAVDENKLVKITAETTIFNEIAILTRSLENSTSFSDVKLVSSTAVDSTTGSKINFAISLKLTDIALKSTILPTNPSLGGSSGITN